MNLKSFKIPAAEPKDRSKSAELRKTAFERYMVNLNPKVLGGEATPLNSLTNRAIPSLQNSGFAKFEMYQKGRKQKKKDKVRALERKLHTDMMKKHVPQKFGEIPALQDELDELHDKIQRKGGA